MLTAQIEMILLLTGLATCGAVVVLFAPVTILKLVFGEAPTNAVSVFIARHWGLLVFLVGALLVCASHHPEIRFQALVFAIVEKTIGSIGIFISPFRRRPAALAVALIDASMAAIYIIFLAGR